MGAILGTPDSFQPVYWIAGYIAFVALNCVGVEMSFRVTLGVAIWFGIGITYFAVWGRHKLIMSPEEEFAMAHHERVRVGADV